MRKLLAVLALLPSLLGAQQARQMTRSTSATTLGDSSLVVVSDTLTSKTTFSTKAASLDQVRKALSKFAFDSVKSTNVFRALSTSFLTGAVTLSSTLTGGATSDIAINTNKFTVAASSGNTVVAGTLGVTGVATLTAQPILSSLTASLPVFTDGSKGLVSNAKTGSGSVVMSVAPTFTGTITLAGLVASSSADWNGTFTATSAVSIGASMTATAGMTGELLIQGTLNAAANSDWMRPLRVAVTANPNGLLTTQYAGIYVANASAGGTIGTSYGLYVESQSTATTNYGIYVAGGPNVLTGAVSGITTATAGSSGGGATFISTTAGDLTLYDQLSNNTGGTQRKVTLGIYATSNRGGNGFVGTETNHSFNFQTNDAVRGTISNTGAWDFQSNPISGITTITSSGLQTNTLAGTALTFTPASASYVAIRFNLTGGSSAGFLGPDRTQTITSGSTDGDMILRFDQGNLRISSSAATIATFSATGALTVTGIPSEGSTQNALCITSGGAFQQNAAASCLVSSRRYKDNILPLVPTRSHTILNQLHPVSYREKASGRLGFGLIAEDVLPIEPRLVGMDRENKPQSVMYEMIVPLLIEKVQSLQSQIDSLRAQRKP